MGQQEGNMFRNLIACALVVAGLAAAAPARAAQYDRLSMTQLTGILQSGGFSVGGTSRSDVVAVGGTFIYLTDCGSDGKCAEINFFRNYNDVFPTLQAVNQWNNTKKIPEASVNSNGTLHMEIWMSAIGVTDTALLDTFRWFEKFAADVDFWGPFIRRSS